MEKDLANNGEIAAGTPPSQEEIEAAAQELNPLYFEKFGLRLFEDIDPASKSFVWRIKHYQAILAEYMKDLAVDGIFSTDFANALLGRKEYGPRSVDYIVVGGERVKIKGVEVIDFTEKRDDALSFVDFPNTFRMRKSSETLERITIHWDVSKTSIDCFHILRRRGYSSHFGINYDGVVYQWLDPVKHHAYHNKHDNSHAVGIDLNNPVHIKFKQFCNEVQHTYRPVLNRKNFSGIKDYEFLGATVPQIESLRKLLPVLCEKIEVPLVGPKPEERWWVIEDIHERKGVFCHLNYTRNKWDFEGLPWDDILS